MRVGVHDGLVADHPALRAQVADDVAVGVEDQLAFVLGHERGELAVRIHRDDKVDAVLLAGEHIVLTERRRLVDDTGAVFGGHVIRVEDHKRVVVVAEVVEDWLVLQALQLGTHVRGHHVVVAELLAVRAEQARRQQQLLIDETFGPVRTDLHQRVLHFRVDGERQVRRQGPRGGGPRDRSRVVKLGVLCPRLSPRESFPAAGQRQRDGDGGVLAVTVRVIQAGLLIGQRSVLGPGVRQDAEALVDQALVVELLERPHDGLHVLRVHGLVAVFKVDPARLASDVVLPLPRVVHHRLRAVLVELL